MNAEHLVKCKLAEKLKYLEKTNPNDILSTTDAIWPDLQRYPCGCSVRPATTHLSYITLYTHTCYGEQLSSCQRKWDDHNRNAEHHLPVITYQSLPHAVKFPTSQLSLKWSIICQHFIEINYRIYNSLS
jgi:hypothetical protein